jgi:hypothetical protein
MNAKAEEFVFLLPILSVVVSICFMCYTNTSVVYSFHQWLGVAGPEADELAITCNVTCVVPSCLHFMDFSFLYMY